MGTRSAMRAIGLLGLVTVVGCGLRLRPAGVAQDASPGPVVIDADAIAQSGAKTVWDALARTVHFYTFHPSGRIEHRGRSSLVLPEQPIVVLDGVALNDMVVLLNMPAGDVALIEVLDGVDATTFYGTNAGSGVIRIWTRGSRS